MKALGLYFLLLCYTGTALAQDLPSLNLSDNTFVGRVIFGGNITRLTGTNYAGFHKVGYNTGLGISARLKKKIWGSIELLYSQKGEVGVRQEESVYVGPYFEKYTAKLNYAEIPVMLEYYYNKWYHISVGASYSQLITSNEDLVSYQPTNLYSAISPFNQKEIDLLIGGGVHVNKNLYLNIRYQHSVTPVRNAFYVPPMIGAGNQNNVMFAFQLAYMLRNNKNLRNDDPSY